MKKLFTIIILIFACQNLIFAQEEAISVEDLVAATIVDSAVAIVEENNDIATDNSPRLKLNWNQKKQIRKQADADYFAWERKYFNSPGNRWWLWFPISNYRARTSATFIFFRQFKFRNK